MLFRSSCSLHHAASWQRQPTINGPRACELESHCAHRSSDSRPLLITGLSIRHRRRQQMKIAVRFLYISADLFPQRFHGRELDLIQQAFEEVDLDFSFRC